MTDGPPAGAAASVAGGPAVLVMAKAPVPGRAKTRLGALVGDRVAADLAAAAILDTLDVCESAFVPASRRHVALAGDLGQAARGTELTERLRGWTVHPQRGDGFAERLVHAHHDAGGTPSRPAVPAGPVVPVVQIGMDTPHLSAADLQDVARRLGRGNDAVLGPAADGGWWVLAVTHPRLAAALRGVEMSTDHTYADTLEALRRIGATVASAATRRDVDTAEDAAVVAAHAPWTRFAELWSRAPEAR